MNLEYSKPVVLISCLRAGGGAERQVEVLVNAGVFSKVVTLENINEFDIDSSMVHSLSGHGRHNSRFFKMLFIPVYAWRLAQYLKSHDCRVVFSVMQRANFVSIIAKLFFSHTAITNTQVHVFSLYRSVVGRTYLKLMKFLFPYANVISANSLATLNDLVENFGLKNKNCFVLPNLYDTDLIKQRASLDLPGFYADIMSRRCLLCVGRLTAQKCHWYTLRIFMELKKEHPELVLVILNDGDLRNEVIDYSKRLGLKTWSVFDDADEELLDCDIYFLGVQKNPYQFYKRAALSIHLSICEGLPNALIEARIAGAVCISSDCPSGPREIIAPDTSVRDIASGFEFYDEGVLIQPFANDIPDWDVSRSLSNAENAWLDALKICLSDSVLMDRKRRVSAEKISRYDIKHVKKYTPFLRDIKHENNA
ncbi:MAG: glycosyltransferase [Gammaproteobacteria bacterium]